MSDKQIRKNPGQVAVLCEATDEVAQLLKLPPEPGMEHAGADPLEKRASHQHMVVRGNEKISHSDGGADRQLHRAEVPHERMQ